MGGWRSPWTQRFVARVAIPFLRDMWNSHLHLGSVPDVRVTSGNPAETETIPQGAHVSVKRTAWVMDTGSGHDLVPQHVVQSSSLSVKPPDSTFSLSTANGPLAVESVAKIRAPTLNSESEALVLPSTPTVLSIGRRCVQEGYSLVGEANQNPHRKTPDGKIIP